MIAPLQLNNFYTDSLLVRSNESFVPGSKENQLAGKIHCEINISRAERESKKHYRVEIVFSILPASKKPALDPYEIHLRIFGFFTCREEISEEETKRLVTLNGSSILYGIARGEIAQITGGGRYGKYILPALNIAEMVKQSTIHSKKNGKESRKKETLISTKKSRIKKK